MGRPKKTVQVRQTRQKILEGVLDRYLEKFKATTYDPELEEIKKVEALMKILGHLKDNPEEDAETEVPADADPDKIRDMLRGKQTEAED